MTSCPKLVTGFLAIVALASCKPPAEVGGQATSRSLTPTWQVSVGGPSTSLNVALVTNTTVVVGGARTLVGLEPSTGARKWVIQVPFLLPYAGLSATTESVAALVSGDGYLVFDPRDGRILRSLVSPNQSGNPSGTIPQQLADGRILYATRGRELLALSPLTGAVDTLVRLPGDSVRNSYIASIIVYRDTIYSPVASDARRGAAFRNTVPYRFSLRSRVLDSLQADPSDSSSLSRWMIATQDLLVSSTDYSDPSWLGYDRSSGIRRWKVPASPASLGPFSQVAIVSDTLFAGANDGFAYVVLLSSGTLVRKLSIPSGLVAGVAACGSDIIINVTGELTALARSGSDRITVRGLTEGQSSFIGDFAVGANIAVIGNGAGGWVAFPCTPP